MTTTVRKPVVVVMGPKTANLIDVWGDALTSIHIEDGTGKNSDKATFTFRVAAPYPAMPPKGTRYVVSLGWSETSRAKTGVYTVQRAGLGGDPESGTAMKVECRAADLADTVKTSDSGHWDDKTLGEIVDDVAGRMGASAVVDPALRSIKIGYRARIDQEAGDFLSDLVEDFGGAVKFADGKVVVLARGSGRSASGATLPTITITHDPAYEFNFEFEPRGDDAESIGGWWDDETGTWREESDQGDGKGRLARPHGWPSEAEAKHGARAARQERKRQSATGSVQGPGDPAAVAGCPVVCKGFGPDADATAWVAKGISHEIDPGASGWIMTIELETKTEKED